MKTADTAHKGISACVTGLFSDFQAGPLDEAISIPDLILSLLIVIKLSRSGRDCSCQRPRA